MDRYDYQQQLEEQERQEQEDGDFRHDQEWLAEMRRLKTNRQAWADWADQKERKWP